MTDHTSSVPALSMGALGGLVYSLVLVGLCLFLYKAGHDQVRLPATTNRDL